VRNCRVYDFLERLLSHDLLVQSSEGHILKVENVGILFVNPDLALDHGEDQHVLFHRLVTGAVEAFQGCLRFKSVFQHILLYFHLS
jgi:hypothetical protein